MSDEATSDAAIRVVVAGGGTGGHLFPGLAVAQALRAEGVGVTFVGARDRLEARLVPQWGFPFHGLRLEGLVGRGGWRQVRALALVPGALGRVFLLLGRLKPACVLGVGSYASAPVVLAAVLRRLPTVILEQNRIPGLTNRILGRMVDRVAVAFQETCGFFPAGKAIHTGNPLREDLGGWSQPEARRALGLDPQRPTVLVLGGSRGARTLNRVAVEAARELQRREVVFQVIHQAGEEELESVKTGYRPLGTTARVMSFIREMGQAYSAADLVVCRAGATTLAELTALGKPSVLVPFPHAAHGHQEANGRALEAAGAARMIMESVLDARRLAQEVSNLLGDPARLETMGRAARALGQPEGLARVVAVVKELIAGEWVNG